MILAFLLRVWALPWPPFVRRRASGLLSNEQLQRLLLPQFRVGVVGIIEDERGRILLLRHTYRERFPWGLPTGFLERREQPEVALRREIREESGLEIELKGVWGTYVDPVRPLLNVVFHGQVSGGSFVPSLEVSQAEYFEPESLPPMVPDQRRILQEFQR